MGCLVLVFYCTLGFGIFASKEFSKGDFIVEYAGDSINEEEAVHREQVYEKEKQGSYLFFFSKYW